MEVVKQNEITKSYYDVHDIEILLGVKTRKAYYIIAQLNNELEKKGALVISGKINKAYFDLRWNGKNQN